MHIYVFITASNQRDITLLNKNGKSIFGLIDLGILLNIQKVWQGDCDKNAQNGYDNNQFDQGEPTGKTVVGVSR